VRDGVGKAEIILIDDGDLLMVEAMLNQCSRERHSFQSLAVCRASAQLQTSETISRA
jgi:hypothetical protein